MEGQRDGSILLFGAIFCWFVDLLTVAAASLFVWTLRDGLGPDAVESHGLLGLSRFWRDMRSILILYVVPLLVLGCALSHWAAHRRRGRALGDTQPDSSSVRRP